MTLLNEPVEVDLEPDVEKGEVLLDSCGQGVYKERKEEIIRFIHALFENC
jgi:hypothetical protein